MVRRLKDTLGWLTGSVLGVLVILSIVALPIMLVLWAGVALGVPWAIAGQVWLYVTVATWFAALNDLLPPWAWFLMVTLFWLAFLDVHVRALVRDELAKHLKAFEEREQP